MPSAVQKRLDRIQCLAISAWHLEFLIRNTWGHQVAHLQRLELTVGYAGCDSFIFGLLTRKRFPMLRSLHWPGTDFGFNGRFPSAFMNFIPLQYLCLGISCESHWVDIVRACATTLKGLEIRGYVDMDRIGSTIPPYNIVLPVLQSLHLNYDLDWRSRVRHYPFRIVTPALTCIEMGSQQNTKTTPFAVHTSQVTHLRLHGFYIPDHYPALKVLPIHQGNSPCLQRSTETK